MKISVAMATFNGEKYLREQLNSIAAQSVQPDELIVVDDASADETIRIIEEFGQEVLFPVRVLVHETNTGSTLAFMNAISKCSCELIALSDQDDICYPDKLSLLRQQFTSPEVGFAFSNAELMDGNGNPTGKTLWESVRFDRYRQQLYRRNPLLAVMKYRFVTGATLMFRADLKKHVLPFPSGMVHDAWIATVATCLGNRGVALDDKLIRYRCHAGQQIGAGSGVRRQPHRKRYSISLSKMTKDQRLCSYEKQIGAYAALRDRVMQYMTDKRQKMLLRRLIEDRVLELEILIDAFSKRGAQKVFSLFNKNARKLFVKILQMSA